MTTVSTPSIRMISTGVPMVIANSQYYFNNIIINNIINIINNINY